MKFGDATNKYPFEEFDEKFMNFILQLAFYQIMKHEKELAQNNKRLSTVKVDIRVLIVQNQVPKKTHIDYQTDVCCDFISDIRN